VFVPGNIFQSGLLFVGKAGTYISSAPLKDRHLALPVNSTLGWKGLTENNTLAYFVTMRHCYETFFIG
jgi:hypothetical protein